VRKILGLIALGLSVLASPLAAQRTESSARGVRVNETVTTQLGTASGQINSATSNAAFPAGPPSDADPVASLNQTIDLGAALVGLSERVTTSAIDTRAVASETGAMGTATVNDLAFSLRTADISLLSITATSVQSTSTATVSPLDATGTAQR